jgi:hypothetical protein
MSAYGEHRLARLGFTRGLPTGPRLKLALRVGRWLALVGAGAALGAVFLRAPDGGAEAGAAPGRVASEQLDALAFRLALLERRAAPAASAPLAPGARELLTLLALQELAERVERGLPFEGVLPAVDATPAAALQTLALHAPRGVPTQRRLEADFARLRPLIESQAAPAGTTGLGRTLGRLQGLAAELNLMEPPPADATRLAIAAMAAALSEARLGAVLAEAARLDAAARQMADAWLTALRARDDVLSSIEILRRSTWQALANSR